MCIFKEKKTGGGVSVESSYSGFDMKGKEK